MGLCGSAQSGTLSAVEKLKPPVNRIATQNKLRSPSMAHSLHHGEMSAWTSLDAASCRPAGEFVVFLGGANNVPNMDELSLSDCYVNMSICDAAGTMVSPAFRSTVRQDSLSPTWNTFVSFPIRPQGSDVLHLSLLDEDSIVKDDAIGFASLPVSQLRAHTLGNPKVLDLQLSTRQRAPDPDRSTTILLSVLGRGEGPQLADDRDQDDMFEIKKEFYLIRHGESKWNEGEKNKDVIEMLGVDHALNETGIQQAMSFNKKWKDFLERVDGDSNHGRFQDDEEARQQTEHENCSDSIALQRAFLKAERVISSPLTRAIETALLTCQDHRALDPVRGGQKLLLFRNLREKKNGKMSLDTVGKAMGTEIVQRVRKELLLAGGISPEMVDLALSPEININDCDSMWWTSATHGDSKYQIKMRFNELWGTLKYIKETSVILVGHSLFFREMMTRFLGGTFRAENPEFAKNLCEKKLDNAACLYVKVHFKKGRHDIPETMPEIIDARLLFGSRFKEKRDAESKT